jgi:hypothetical protein
MKETKKLKIKRNPLYRQLPKIGRNDKCDL